MKQSNLLLEKIHKHRKGIMGTIIFHLIFLISVFSIELQKAVIHEEIAIEMLAETTQEQEERKEIENKIEERQKQTSQEEVNKMLRSIAVNEDIKPSQERSSSSVDDYINEVMQELENGDHGGKYKHSRDKNFTQDSLQNAKDKNAQKLDSLQSTFYSGESSVSYFLEGRHAVYLPIPVFKCENGGTIIVNIWVNRNGSVQSAKIAPSTPSEDECLLNVAIDAAKRSRFNKKSNAPSSQEGKITYHFVRQ